MPPLHSNLPSLEVGITTRRWWRSSVKLVNGRGGARRRNLPGKKWLERIRAGNPDHHNKNFNALSRGGRDEAYEEAKKYQLKYVLDHELGMKKRWRRCGGKPALRVKNSFRSNSRKVKTDRLSGLQLDRSPSRGNACLVLLDRKKQEDLIGRNRHSPADALLPQH